MKVSKIKPIEHEVISERDLDKLHVQQDICAADGHDEVADVAYVSSARVFESQESKRRTST